MTANADNALIDRLIAEGKDKNRTPTRNYMVRAGGGKNACETLFNSLSAAATYCNAVPGTTVFQRVDQNSSWKRVVSPGEYKTPGELIAQPPSIASPETLPTSTEPVELEILDPQWKYPDWS